MSNEISLGHQLSILSRTFRRFFTARMGDWNLPVNSVPLLIELYRHPGASQDQLAAIIAVEKSVMAKLCKLLAERQLIRRETNPEDRREYRLNLEPEGEALVENILSAQRTWNEQLSRDLTPEELAQLQALLSKIMRSAREAI